MHPPPYQGATGLNFFSEDRLLQAILARLLPEDSRGRELESLAAFGELCGGRLSLLIEAAHREENLPKLTRYDRWGQRIDRIDYCSEQLAARRMVVTSGVLPPRPLFVRSAMGYLLNQNGEGGITCPLAMTDGTITLLEEYGTPEQRRKWLPLLRDPGGPTPLTAGQFVTEQQGGSNVAANEARAEQGPDGKWRLTGLKWFCSNPGELWATTAKPVGSDRVALFLMPHRLADGRLNEAHILRLKAINGTRGKATAEVEYRGAEAELIGRASHGMAILLRTVLKTSRIHTTQSSLGFMRRAFVEASLYAAARFTYGRPLQDLPAVAASLRLIEARLTACTLAFFESLKAIEASDPAADVLIPLLKLGITREGTRAVREAQLIFGGNGILKDFSVLPRLADDALVNEIWEGAHPVLASHALKALLRPASGAAFTALLQGGDRDLGKRLQERIEALSARENADREAEALPVCDLAFQALTASLLAREAGRELDIATPFSSLKERWCQAVA